MTGLSFGDSDAFWLIVPFVCFAYWGMLKWRSRLRILRRLQLSEFEYVAFRRLLGVVLCLLGINVALSFPRLGFQ